MLSNLEVGVRATIVEYKGRKWVKENLKGLGFLPGSEIKVIKRYHDGRVKVELKGKWYTLDFEEACSIWVCILEPGYRQGIFNYPRPFLFPFRPLY